MKPKWLTRIGARGMLLAALVLLMSCDPTYRYEPVEWQRLENLDQWQFIAGNIEIRTNGAWGVMGDDSLGITFDVNNKSDQDVKLESAYFRVDGIELYSPSPGEQGDRLGHARPHASLNIFLIWEFESNVTSVLGRAPALFLLFREGDRAISVEMKWVRAK